MAKNTAIEHPDAVEDLCNKVPALSTDSFKVRLVGRTPLIVHCFSAKSKIAIADKQGKKAKSPGLAARDPQQEYIDSMYYFPEDEPAPGESRSKTSIPARTGFPLTAFKNAAADMGVEMKGMYATTVRRSFHVYAEPGKGTASLVEIQGTPCFAEHTVRLKNGSGDIRYRAQYDTWAVDLVIVRNAEILSVEEIKNLFAHAGFSVGVGEWRPQRKGIMGQFDFVDVVSD